MRIAALIFGLLGTAGSGTLGVKWTNDVSATKATIDSLRPLAEKSPVAAEKLAQYDRLVRAAYALLGGAALGAVGCGLVLGRKGVIAGVLFLVAFASPMILAQDGKMAIFTFGLAVAALFAFFMKPGTAEVPPRRRYGIPRDADMVG